MILTKLEIERPTWGNDKGKLIGRVTIQGEESITTIRLSEDLAMKIINLCADGLVEAAHGVATIMKADIIKALPAPEDGSDASA